VTTDGMRSPDVTPRADGSLPIKLLHDRLLVRTGGPEGERKSSGGILIPATAEVAKRLTWARTVAIGPNVRTVEVGDQVLFDPEAPAHVELQGREYLLLRERDVHAVAGSRHSSAGTGLYL
jgi:chaperonin GroES